MIVRTRRLLHGMIYGSHCDPILDEQNKEQDYVRKSQTAYRRILLKLSGEALMGDGDYGIEPAVIRRIAEEIHGLISEGGVWRLAW